MSASTRRRPSRVAQGIVNAVVLGLLLWLGVFLLLAWFAGSR